MSGDELLSQLITEPAYEQVFTAVRKTDTRTAMVRAIAQYLRRLSHDADGVTYAFKKVYEEWPDAEATTTYPACIVSTADKQGRHSESTLVPVVENVILEVPGQWLQYAGDLEQDITIEVLCSNTQERTYISAMLEDAMNPVEWMSGIRLTLPFYFNATCTVTPGSISYADNQVDAARRWRTWSQDLVVTAPILRVREIVPFDVGGPRFKLTAGTSLGLENKPEYAASPAPRELKCPPTLLGESITRQGPPGPPGPPGPVGTFTDGVAISHTGDLATNLTVSVVLGTTAGTAAAGNDARLVRLSAARLVSGTVATLTLLDRALLISATGNFSTTLPPVAAAAGMDFLIQRRDILSHALTLVLDVGDVAAKIYFLGNAPIAGASLALSGAGSGLRPGFLVWSDGIDWNVA